MHSGSQICSGSFQNKAVRFMAPRVSMKLKRCQSGFTKWLLNIAFEITDDTMVFSWM